MKCERFVTFLHKSEIGAKKVLSSITILVNESLFIWNAFWAMHSNAKDPL